MINKNTLNESIMLIQNILDKQKHHKKQTTNSKNWDIIARENQKIPTDPWSIWLILAGRGFGKTRTGAESIRKFIDSGLYKNICLIGHSLHETRQIMVEGHSGLLSVCSDNQLPVYEPSKRLLSWQNGAKATLFSGDSYDQLRGSQFDCAWIDEFAKFKHPDETFNQLMLCMRLGQNPKTIITTTPRPLLILQKLLQRPDVITTYGSTFDNRANLSDIYIENIEKTYSKTRFGLQEIYGQIIERNENPLWNPNMILYSSPDHSGFQNTIIAIDPATTNHENSNETGIIVASKHIDGKIYVVDDLSTKCSPTEWLNIVAHAYHKYNAQYVIAETNNGGDFIQHLLQNIYPNIKYQSVRATYNKLTRAEPIAIMYEKQLVYHIKPFELLEKQMINYNVHDNSSPDRLDALVWAITWLNKQQSDSSIKIFVI